MPTTIEAASRLVAFLIREDYQQDNRPLMDQLQEATGFDERHTRRLLVKLMSCRIVRLHYAEGCLLGVWLTAGYVRRHGLKTYRTKEMDSMTARQAIRQYLEARGGSAAVEQGSICTVIAAYYGLKPANVSVAASVMFKEGEIGRKDQAVGRGIGEMWLLPSGAAPASAQRALTPDPALVSSVTLVTASPGALQAAFDDLDLDELARVVERIVRELPEQLVTVRAKAEALGSEVAQSTARAAQLEVELEAERAISQALRRELEETRQRLREAEAREGQPLLRAV